MTACILLRPPRALRDQRPDNLLILPLHIAEEVGGQLSDLAAQGTRFATALSALSGRSWADAACA